MTFKIQKNFIEIFAKEIAIKMDAYYYPEKRSYRAPKTLGAMRELYALTGDKEVQKEAIAMRDKDKALSKIKQGNSEWIDYKEITPDMNNFEKWNTIYPKGFLKLKPHQNSGTEFGIASLKKNGFVFYFDEPRTGKTPKSIYTMDKMGCKKVIIAQLGGVLKQFKEDVEDWQKINRKVITIDGYTKLEKRLLIYEEFEATDNIVLIISYSTIKNDIEHLSCLFPDLLICDEPHKKIKNPSKSRFKAIRKLAKSSQFLIMLTGTPIDNLKEETFVYLAIAMPKVFANQEAFKMRYFTAMPRFLGSDKTKPGDWKRHYEIIELLDSKATNEKNKQKRPSLEMIDIPISSRQAELIDEIETTGEIEMDKKEKFEIDDPILKQKVEIETKYYPIESPLTARLLTRQALVCASAIKGMEVKKPSPKLMHILKHLLNNPSRRVLIFTDHKRFIIENEKFFKKLKIDYAIIHGGIKNSERDLIRKKLNSGEIQVVIGQVLTVSTGGTFNGAQDIFFLNLPYNPSELRQASDRLLDFSDDKNEGKRVFVLRHPGTMDIKNEESIAEKMEYQKFVNSFEEQKSKLIMEGSNGKK